MLAGSGTPPPEENPTERKYNFLLPQSRSPAYWPVISANAFPPMFIAGNVHWPCNRQLTAELEYLSNHLASQSFGRQRTIDSGTPFWAERY
jgi:hypothetical protein